MSPLIFLYGGKPRYAPGKTIWCDSAIVVDACIQALAELDADMVVGAGNQELPCPLPANFIPLDYRQLAVVRYRDNRNSRRRSSEHHVVVNRHLRRFL